MNACQVAGCDRPARGRFCELHWKRHQRGQDLGLVGESRLTLGQADDLVTYAAIALADARSSSTERTAHFKQALAGAKEGSLLAKNLVTHAQLLQAKGKSLGDLRAELK